MEIIPLAPALLSEPLIVVRETLDTPKFRELVADVRAHGLEVAIIVRAVNGTFRVVDGYRRWRAAREAGLLEIPCEVRTMSDAEEIGILMRVALHREDFTPLEEGKMFATMHEGLSLTYEGIARQVGKSVGYVADRIAAVSGPLEIRQALAAGEITLTVALELLRVTHEGDRTYLLHWARTQGASGATVRGWVQERLQARAAAPAAPPPATAAEQYGTPPVAMGLCEWHGGPSPLNGLLSLRVCTACFNQLQVVKSTLQAAHPAEEGGDHGVPGQGPR